MNILYIGTYNSIHDLKWMRYFSNQKGFKVFFVSEKQNLPLGYQHEEIVRELKKDNIHFLGSLNSFSIFRILNFLNSVLWLKDIIRENKVDITHILFATPHALWGLFLNTPYVITSRGSDVLVVIPNLLRKTALFRQVYNRILFSLFRISFQKSKVVTCTSVSQAEMVKTMFRLDEVRVIRTGVDVEHIEALDDSTLLNVDLRNKKFIFSPRFFSPIYNIQLQLDAIAELSKSIIDKYFFVFVRGRNFDQEYANDILRQLVHLKSTRGLNFIIEDYLDQKTLWMYFKAAALTIMTPISDGTPNSALEAMAAKCPLILPPLPYDKEIFANSTLVLSKYDKSELAGLISQAITSYPTGMLEMAHQRAHALGNRNIEMNKISQLYHSTGIIVKNG